MSAIVKNPLKMKKITSQLLGLEVVEVKNLTAQHFHAMQYLPET